MPVRKFPSIEEMDAFTWRRPGDPDLLRAMGFVFDLARRTNPRTFTPGVYRYRSIEDMNRADDHRLTEHVAARRPAGLESPSQS